jgi:hypothetical protein
MISSEVQRTLVKSPPELWAELSDPAALARHLGELGDIRITRVEPEKLVEWEAEGTTGTVAIKPSGWGTKVTLSVNRELAAADSESSEDPEGSADDGDDTAKARALPDLSSTAPTDAHPESPLIEAQEPSADAAGGQIAVELDLWASQGAEGAETSMITAAERFAHDDPEPLLGSRLIADPAAEGLDVANEPRTVEPIPVPVEPPPVPSEPRRGLLARLFGRRRKQTQSAQPPATEEPIAITTPDPTPTTSDAGPSSELPTLSPAALPASPSLIAAEDAQPPAEDLSNGVDLTVESQPAPVAAEQEDVATGEESPERAASEPAVDLAVELRQAEEAASEEVTAVLRGVLDRLGAAHHRPFSRS